MGLLPLDSCIKKQLDSHLRSIEQELDADSMAIVSPIPYGLEARVRVAIESKSTKRPSLAIVLDYARRRCGTANRGYHGFHGSKQFFIRVIGAIRGSFDFSFRGFVTVDRVE